MSKNERINLSPLQEHSVSPQAILVFERLAKTRDKGLSALEAFVDYGITSATLASRVCDLEKVGVTIQRQRRVHPVTGKRYTRYFLAGNDPSRLDYLAGLR